MQVPEILACYLTRWHATRTSNAFRMHLSRFHIDTTDIGRKSNVHSRSCFNTRSTCITGITAHTIRSAHIGRLSIVPFCNGKLTRHPPLGLVSCIECCIASNAQPCTSQFAWTSVEAGQSTCTTCSTHILHCNV